MKIKPLILVLATTITSNLLAQKATQQPWNNHKNYKQEIIETIKKSPSLKTNFGYKLREHQMQQKSKAGKPQFPDFEFVNGINIAWVAFGRDIGLEVTETFTKEWHPNLVKFGEIFDKVSNSGGDVIRWWLHTNGSTNPVFDQNDEFVVPNPDFFLNDLKAILDLAVEKGVKIQICLWSFDMLKGTQWRVNSARNKKIMTSNTHLQAYLDNSLVPLVKGIGNHPGLYAWELFNEPEGMTTEYASHWPGFTDKISIVDVQKTVNKMASAIRNAQPGVKITNGTLGFTSGVDNLIFGYFNNYTDARLFDKGGKYDGYLDIYNLHYYDWAKEQGSPFHNTFASTGLDKPTVISEYYPQKTFGVSVEQLGPSLVEKGWHGTLIWSWTDRGWSAMEPVVETTNQALNEVTLNAPDFELNQLEVSLYPNPVIKQLNLRNIPEGISNLIISDSYGRLVLNQKTKGNFATVNIAEFSSGTYILSLRGNKSTLLSKKFIKF